MTIRQVTSAEAQTCWMCLNIGIPVHGIAPGEPHFVIASSTVSERCCADCFERLYAEVGGTGDGEKWKES